jgi:hypothetical protein
MLEASSTGEKYGHPGNCIGFKVLSFVSNSSIDGLPNNKLCAINVFCLVLQLTSVSVRAGRN